MTNTNPATSQGGDAARSDLGSLGYSNSRSVEAAWGSQTVWEGLTADERVDQGFLTMATHQEDSELDGYLGDSPKYDEEDFEDEGFVTAAGGETDRASQASGHGGTSREARYRSV